VQFSLYQPDTVLRGHIYTAGQPHTCCRLPVRGCSWFVVQSQATQQQFAKLNYSSPQRRTRFSHFLLFLRRATCACGSRPVHSAAV
jgi:hypothetical protein